MPDPGTPAATADQIGRGGINASSSRRQTRRFGAAVLFLTAAFALPLYQLIRLALTSEIHSHLILIPFVSAYFVWINRRDSTAIAIGSPKPPAVLAGSCGLAILGLHWFLRHGSGLPTVQFLWSAILAYLLLVLSAALFSFGYQRLKPHAFALLFLVFMIPLPTSTFDWISQALQRASAEAADIGLRLTGLPVFREGMFFKLPGLTIQVAEECSGIRSSIVLFITSLVASKLFLRSQWKRAVFVLATIPLGILRNAFRITVLAWLTVNVDEGIIHGPLHHRGGPIFFALSLLPLFALLWLLRRSERSVSPLPARADATPAVENRN